MWKKPVREFSYRKKKIALSAICISKVGYMPCRWMAAPLMNERMIMPAQTPIFTQARKRDGRIVPLIKSALPAPCSMPCRHVAKARSKSIPSAFQRR